MSANQKKGRKRTKEMIENRNVNIITDADNKKLVLINDIRFKAKVREDWKAVEEYLKEYIGELYEIEETSEKYTFLQISPMNMPVRKAALP